MVLDFELQIELKTNVSYDTATVGCSAYVI